MKRKPYWEMTTEELRQATKEFDQEFVADKAKPLTPAMQARWRKAKKKSRTHNGDAQQVISVRLEKRLVKQCTNLAKKKGVSRDAVIARGLKALLDAERRR